MARLQPALDADADADTSRYQAVRLGNPGLHKLAREAVRCARRSLPEPFFRVRRPYSSASISTDFSGHRPMAPSCPGPGAGPRCPCAQGRGGLTPVPEPTGRGSAISSLRGAGPQRGGKRKGDESDDSILPSRTLGPWLANSPSIPRCLGSCASGFQHSVHSEYSLTQLSNWQLAAPRTDRASRRQQKKVRHVPSHCVMRPFSA